MLSPSPLKRVAIYGPLVLWSLFCLFPLYWLALAAFKAPKDLEFGPFYLPFVDFTPTFASWQFILFDQYENLRTNFINSVIIATCATFLTINITAFLIYGATRFGHRGLKRIDYLLSATLSTRLLPPVVVVVPLYMMAMASHLLDTWLILILVYTAINLPVAVWLLRPVFGARASDQEEAALLDGASRLRILVEIVFPMFAASLAATGLVIFILCWNEYLIAASLAMDHAMTLPPWTVGQLSMKEAQAGGEAEEWGRLSAATVLMTVPLIALTGTVQRLLARQELWRR